MTGNSETPSGADKSAETFQPKKSASASGFLTASNGDDVALEDQWLSAQTVAAGIESCDKTVRRAAWKGELPSYRLGRLLRFKKSDVLRWIASAKTGSAQ